MDALGLFVSTRFAVDVTALVFGKGTLVLGLAALTARLLRSCGPRVRNAVWTAGLIGLVALPLAVAALPAWGAGPWRYPAETMLLGMEALETVSAGGPTGAVDAGAIPLASALLIVWWIGALLVAVRLAGDLAAARALRARCSPVDPGEPLARILDEERRRLGIPRSVILLVTPEPGLAATMGALRPCVVLGADVAAMPEDRLRALLVHELAHVRRRDAAVQLLANLGMPLFWPNPAYWWARRRAALEREQACDQEVLRRGITSAQYARLLLDFATRYGAPRRRRAAHALLPFSPTRARIHAVLDGLTGTRPLGAVAAGALTVALLGAALPVSTVRLVSAQPGTGRTSDLVTALASADPGVRARAARTLGRRDPAGVRTELEALLDDPDADVRLAAMGGLEQLADPASLPAMAHVLQRPFGGDTGEHGYVLKLAMRTLSHIGTPAALDALEGQLDRPVEQLRWLALESMLQAPGGPPRAIPHLERFASSDPSERNRRLAARALGTP